MLGSILLNVEQIFSLFNFFRSCPEVIILDRTDAVTYKFVKYCYSITYVEVGFKMYFISLVFQIQNRIKHVAAMRIRIQALRSHNIFLFFSFPFYVKFLSFFFFSQNLTSVLI